MINLTLRQLRYLEALARHRHVGRAAAACAVSQPALSMQLRELEAALGAPLFERGARPLRLTPLAEELAARARAVLRAVEEMGELARAARAGRLGRLRLGVIPTVAPYLLPALVHRLARLDDGLDLQLREAVTPRLLEELGDGRLDAALVALPVSEPGLAATPLFREEFLLVRPAAEADRPVPAPERLREMRLLLLEEGHCLRDQALAFCELGGGRPRGWLDGSTLATLVQMVAAGLGVTLLPEMAAPVETRAAAVALSRFAPPPPERSLGLVWRASSPLAPALAGVAAAAAEAGEELLSAARIA
jgi:LysR family hydrogen peroxide-inducible transcriptional activator